MEGGNIAVRHCNSLRSGRRGGLKKGMQEKHRNKVRKTEKNKQSPIQLTESNTNK
jgi:hypothetical protein